MGRKILYAASTDGHLRSFHLPCLSALTERGYIVTAAGNGDGHGLPDGVRFVPVPFSKSFFSLKNIRAVFLLARLIRRERFDTILLHTSLAAFFTRLGVILAGKGQTRVVNTVHGYLFDDKTPLLRRMVLLGAEKLTAGVTDEILTMNEEDTRLAKKHRLCRGAVTEIPGMGVPLSRFSPAGQEQRREARTVLAIGEDALVLLCAAEFSQRKNQAALIRAMKRLPEKTVLLLPGVGEKREECMALARSAGLGERVRFPGFREDLTPYLRAADICVSASRSEGLPFHVMECMACGLPAVLSDVKGHRDLVKDGVTGALWPFGDEDGFVSALRPYLASPGLCREQGERARKAVKQYGLEVVLPVLTEKYTETGMRQKQD